MIAFRRMWGPGTFVSVRSVRVVSPCSASMPRPPLRREASDPADQRMSTSAHPVSGSRSRSMDRLASSGSATRRPLSLTLTGAPFDSSLARRFRFSAVAESVSGRTGSRPSIFLLLSVRYLFQFEIPSGQHAGRRRVAPGEHGHYLVAAGQHVRRGLSKRGLVIENAAPRDDLFI